MSKTLIVPNLIGGKATPGNSNFEVKNPGRPNQVVGEVAEGGAEHVELAVQSALDVSPAWEALSVEERAAAIESGLERITVAKEQLAQTLVAENGALLLEASMDIQRSLELARDILQRAVEHLEPRVIERPDSTVTVLRKPIGVVGLVIPWNSPMVLAASKVFPALVAGNTVILKPSPEAPIALTQAMQLLTSELPPGVLNVVNSAGAAGPALSSHPQVRKMSFTGSITVGREVMGAAAQNIKRISMELGGNDPALLLEDVDLQQSIESLAKGIFTRAGQICFGVKRVYVARSRYNELAEALSDHLDDYVVGYGLDPASSYGPIINERQRDRVQGLIDRAKNEGAHIQTLGRVDEQARSDGGYYMRPTIVRDVSPRSPLVLEEQFGPVIPLIPFDDVEDAVAMANNSEFGLASSVWSADQSAAISVASRLEAGCSFINSHNVWSLSFDMPFGGQKQSGIGRERTALGIDEYVETHAIRAPRRTA